MGGGAAATSTPATTATSAPAEEKKTEPVTGGKASGAAIPEVAHVKVHAPPGGKSSGPLW